MGNVGPTELLPEVKLRWPHRTPPQFVSTVWIDVTNSQADATSPAWDGETVGAAAWPVAADAAAIRSAAQSAIVSVFNIVLPPVLGGTARWLVKDEFASRTLKVTGQGRARVDRGPL